MKPIKYISIEETFSSGPCLFIDVRSQGEYAEDHIPGAVNIPILTDEERAIVGTIYKEQGNEEAKIVGFRLFAQRYQKFMADVRSVIQPGVPTYIYCWRGGSRSEYVLELLQNLGFQDLYKIAGGYKRFRAYALQRVTEWCTSKKAIVLHGYTGAGKTDLLTRLAAEGAPTLCLETLAQNSGSVFGNVFFRENQPSQKKFESLIFDFFMKSDRDFYFVESESKRIGNVFVPDPLMDAIRTGIHIDIQTSADIRVENLYRYYVEKGGGLESLLQPLNRLRKRLGNEVIDTMISQLEQGDYKAVIKPLLFDYYDPLYQYSIDQYVFDYTVSYETLEEAEAVLLKILSELERNPL